MNIKNLLNASEAAGYIGISHTYFYNIVNGKVKGIEIPAPVHTMNNLKFYNRASLNKLKKKYAAKKNGKVTPNDFI